MTIEDGSVDRVRNVGVSLFYTITYKKQMYNISEYVQYVMLHGCHLA